MFVRKIIKPGMKLTGAACPADYPAESPNGDLAAIEKASAQMRAITKELAEQKRILNELRHRLRWKKIEEREGIFW